MTVLEQALEGTKSVAILGHVRPDGDCLGSTLGLYNYLLASYPDVMGLRHCYAHIRSVLNSRPYATKQDLLGSTREGYRITERVLKLFFDLHFFLEKDGTIVPRQVQPIDMAENPAYQEFCAERDRKEKRLTAAWQMKAAAIAALWNN